MSSMPAKHERVGVDHPLEVAGAWRRARRASVGRATLRLVLPMMTIIREVQSSPRMAHRRRCTSSACQVLVVQRGSPRLLPPVRSNRYGSVALASPAVATVRLPGYRCNRYADVVPWSAMGPSRSERGPARGAGGDRRPDRRAGRGQPHHRGRRRPLGRGQDDDLPPLAHRGRSIIDAVRSCWAHLSTPDTGDLRTDLVRLLRGHGARSTSPRWPAGSCRRCWAPPAATRSSTG